MVTQDPNSLKLDLTIRSLPVSQQLLADILNCAMQEPCSWGEVVSYNQTESPEYCRAEIVHEVVVGDAYKIEHLTINTPIIRRGIELLINGALDGMHFPVTKESAYTEIQKIWNWTLEALVSDTAVMIDPVAADIIIQLGLFGEVAYE